MRIAGLRRSEAYPFTVPAGGVTPVPGLQTPDWQNVQNPIFAGGAKGTGVVDDTAAIQAAIDFAAPLGYPIYFPRTNPGSKPQLISNTSGIGVSPIVITTTAPHGIANGTLVWVTGVRGNLAANGIRIATVLSPTQIQFNGTTGSGNYISGGVVQWYQAYTCTAPLRIYPTTYFIGDGSTFVSGFALPPTSIWDARQGASVPFITFTHDGGMPVEPTSRGCFFQHFAFIMPDTAKTDYSFLVDGSTGITFEDVFFQGAEDADPATDPGMFRYLAFESILFKRCSCIWGTTQHSFQGSGAGGPIAYEQTWFYDCNGLWLQSDSNGDHDYTIDGCAFDPLYRTIHIPLGVDLRVNGFSVRNTSFNGLVFPNTWISVTGAGTIEGCDFHTPNIAIQNASSKVNISNNVFNAGWCVVDQSGAVVHTGEGNTCTPWPIADNPGNIYPFNAKRAFIINEPYSGACTFELGPDVFAQSSDGMTTFSFLESYHVGGQPAIGTVVNATNNGGVIDLTFQLPHGLANGALIDVGGVTGTTEANGVNWVVTVVNTYSLTLNGSTFVNPYTGGGKAYFHTFAKYQQFTNGKIHYATDLDQSTNGIVLGGITTVDLENPQTTLHGNTAIPPTPGQQFPNLIVNENFNGDQNYTLPPIVPGMVYYFEKRTDNHTGNSTPIMTISPDPTDLSLGFGLIMTPGIQNGGKDIGEYGDATFNARIRLRAQYWFNAALAKDVKRWLVEDTQGNWLTLNGWTPPMLGDATCLLWFDSTLNVTVAGGLVTQWVDQVIPYTVANGNPATQPTYTPAHTSFNNLPTVTFSNPGSQNLVGVGSLGFSQPITWIIVGDTRNATGGFFTSGAGSMSVYNSGGGPAGTTGMYAGTSQAGATKGIDNGGHVFCCQFDGVKSQAWVDTVGGEPFEFFNQNVGAGGAGILTIGSDNAVANYLTGDIQMIVAYSGVLTYEQRKTVMTWAGARIGRKIVL